MSRDVKEFHWPLRVYIEDTDAGGIVFYVNYLKYMERARTEFMRTYGYDKAALLSEGKAGADLMFVVRRVNVDYRRPAKLDDELTATAKVVEIGKAQLTFEQRILRGDDVLCGGRVNIACVEYGTMKPARIPEELLTSLQNPSS
jgi:tol-pal system-associated acyl-CoA thioesterase